MTSQFRTTACLSKDLSKNWYKQCNRESHPARMSLKQPTRDAVCEELRNGNFDFWRDLRPPFSITKVQKDTESSTCTDHYYHVSYVTPLDYKSERAVFRGKNSSTFDNVMNATAYVRLPPRYHGGRGFRVINWGEPILTGCEPKKELQKMRRSRSEPIKVKRALPIVRDIRIPKEPQYLNRGFRFSFPYISPG